MRKPKLVIDRIRIIATAVMLVPEFMSSLIRKLEVDPARYFFLRQGIYGPDQLPVRSLIVTHFICICKLTQLLAIQCGI